MSDMLTTAIRLGNEATDRAIAMSNRERELRWKLYRLRHLLKVGRTSEAFRQANEAIDYIRRGVGLMAINPRPPISWVHALHQVTGLFALRGDKMSREEQEKVKTILRNVLAEMERDWPTGSAS